MAELVALVQGRKPCSRGLQPSCRWRVGRGRVGRRGGAFLGEARCGRDGGGQSEDTLMVPGRLDQAKCPRL